MPIGRLGAGFGRLGSVGRSKSGRPVNTVAPVLSGTPTQGQTLSVTNGTWTGTATITYAYQWYRALDDGAGHVLTDGSGNPLGTPIGGATSSTYVLVSGDVGSFIFCTVTASNGVGSAAKDSNVTATQVAGNWTPASLGSALLAWYKADVGVFKDAGTTPAADGDRVLQWNDQSGNARHLASTGVFGPIFRTAGLNSLQTLDFINGDGNLLERTSFPLSTAGIASCFFVGSIDSDASSVGRIIGYAAPSQQETGANSCSFLLGHSSTTTLAGYQQGFQSDLTVVNGNNYRFGSIFDGVNHTSYLNNVAQTSTPASFTFTTGGSLLVGAESGGGSSTDGRISEIIVTNTALSSGDRASLDAYLAARWGL